MYIRKTTTVSEEISLVQEHGPGRYGAPGQRRRKRTRKTPEKVRERNRKNRAEKIQLLILSNFYQHGHHIVLGYPKGEAPETFEEAERILRRFLEKIQRREQGQFRYIAATERGKRTAVLHHHMIIQDAPGLMELIEREWPGKRVHSTPTYEDDTMGRQLADYIVKSIDKDGEQGKYHISRNLKKPEVKRDLSLGRMEEPRAPQGYQVVPDTVYIGVNAFTGWPYQRYYLRSIETKRESREAEWNQGFSEIENQKTSRGAVGRLFDKVVNPLVQNGIAAFRIVDNVKSSHGAESKYKEERGKTAKQNVKAPCMAVDNSVDKIKGPTARDARQAKKDSQNGNGLLRVVDKLKTAIGAGREYIEMSRKPAKQNGNAGLRGTDDRDDHTHHNKFADRQEQQAGRDIYVGHRGHAGRHDLHEGRDGV